MIPAGIELRPWQVPMVEHLAQPLPRRALFSGPGTGKTLVVGSHMVHTLKTGLIDRWLVVAPPRVAEDVWAQEFSKWPHMAGTPVRVLSVRELPLLRSGAAPAEMPTRASVWTMTGPWLAQQILNAPPGGVDVVGYSLVERLTTLLKDCWPYDGVVLDEASFLRDAKSKRYRALLSVLRLKRKAAKPPKGLPPPVPVREVIELAGTPGVNDVEQLGPMFALLDGGERLGASMTAFRERWMRPSRYGKGGVVYTWEIDPTRRKAFNAAVATLAVSAQAELPIGPPIETDRFVTLPPAAMQEYARLRSEMLMIAPDGQTILSPHAAARQSKMIQVCNGAVLDETKAVHKMHTVKVEAVVEAVLSHDSPALVAYGYVADRDALARAFGRHPIGYGDKKEDRDAFRRGELKALLFHPESMGHGVDGMQHVSNLLCWVGAHTNAEHYQQTLARIQRDGQQRQVYVLRFFAAGTIEAGLFRAKVHGRMKDNDALLAALKGGEK